MLMSRSRAIIQNTAIQMSGRAASMVLGVVTLGLMTRTLGPTQFGYYATAFSFLQLFGFLVDLGLTLTTVAMIAEDEDRAPRVMGTILSLRMISSAIFLGIAPLVALLFPYPHEVKIAIAIGTLAFFSLALSQIYQGVFQWRLKMIPATIADMGAKIGTLAVTVAIYWLGGGIVAMMVALVTGNAIQLGLLKIFSRTLIRPRLNLDPKLLREIISRSWPIGLGTAFNLIYLRADVIILSLYRGPAEVGLYGAAYKAVDVITVLPFLFMGLVLPFMVRAWTANDRNDFRKILDRTFSVFMLGVIPMIAGTAILGRPLMTLAAGKNFADAGSFLVVLIIAAGTVFFGSLFGHAIVAMGLQRKTVWIYAVDAVISLGLYMLLIPRFGAWGAAGVTIFSELFIAIAAFAVVALKTGFRPSAGPILKSFGATILMLGLLWATPSWPFIPRALTAAAIYGVLLMLFRAVPSFPHLYSRQQK